MAEVIRFLVSMLSSWDILGVFSEKCQLLWDVQKLILTSRVQPCFSLSVFLDSEMLPSCPVCVSFLQRQLLSWFLIQTRLSTSACSSTASSLMACPWMLTRMAASSIQSSPPTLWSQSTPPQKYVVSDALHSACTDISNSSHRRKGDGLVCRFFRALLLRCFLGGEDKMFWWFLSKHLEIRCINIHKNKEPLKSLATGSLL